MATNWKLNGEVYEAPEAENGIKSYLMFHQGLETRGKRQVVTFHVMTGELPKDGKDIAWKSHKFIVEPADIPSLVIQAWKTALTTEWGLPKGTTWQTWIDRKYVKPEDVEAARAELKAEKANGAEKPKAPVISAPPAQAPVAVAANKPGRKAKAEVAK